MKRIINRIIKSEYFPFLIMFFVVFTIHLFVNVGLGDDASFIKVLDKYNIFDWSIFRYNNWSSRNVIEALMVILLKLPTIIWRLLDSLFLTSIAFSISKLFNDSKNNHRKFDWIIIMLVLIYPFYKMNEAGWYATTINYLWPFAFLLLSFYPIKYYFNNKKTNVFSKIFFVFPLLVSANQEQMACIIFCFYFIFNIYLFSKKKYSKYLIILNILSLLSLLYIVTCPGNEIRTIAETATWFPQFSSYSIFDKLSLGVVSTIGVIITETSIIYIIFSILLAIFVFRITKDIFKRFVSLIPIILVSMFTLFFDLTIKFFPFLQNIMEQLKIKGISLNIMSSTSIVSYFPLLISFAFIISVLLSLYLISKNKKNYLIVLIFLAGLASRLILGFSPTVFASGQRTFFAFDFSVIILDFYLFSLLFDHKETNLKKCFSYILVILTCLQIINTIIVI